MRIRTRYWTGALLLAIGGGFYFAGQTLDRVNDGQGSDRKEPARGSSALQINDFDGNQVESTSQGNMAGADPVRSELPDQAFLQTGASGRPSGDFGSTGDEILAEWTLDIESTVRFTRPRILGTEFMCPFV